MATSASRKAPARKATTKSTSTARKATAKTTAKTTAKAPASATRGAPARVARAAAAKPAKGKTATGGRRGAAKVTASKGRATKATKASKAQTTKAAKATKATKATKAKAPSRKSSAGSPGTAEAVVSKTSAGKLAVTKAPAGQRPGAAAEGVVTPSAHFDARFLEAQRGALLEERRSLLDQAERLEDEAATLMEEQEMGDVQFDEESGEGDTMVVERERDLALSGQARQTIAEIDAALARIGDGTYGYSVVSGKPIPKERLKALPWATELVDEKRFGLGTRR